MDWVEDLSNFPSEIQHHVSGQIVRSDRAGFLQYLQACPGPPGLALSLIAQLPATRYRISRF